VSIATITDPFVDAGFPLVGQRIPLDHGYALFSALSRILPRLHSHGSGEPWGIHPIRGVYVGQGLLALDRSSYLRVRLPASKLGEILTLTGQRLDLEGHPVQVGVLRIFPLVPAPRLKARVVTVKGLPVQREQEPQAKEDLVATLRRRLQELVSGQPPERIDIAVGARHVLRVGSKRQRARGPDHNPVLDRDVIIGFAVELSGLEEQASLAIQVHGLGGRRHMGAGIFVPPRRTSA
jgi:CRISPR-associated protein Cas6